MQEQDVGIELDAIEADYGLRLKQYAPEAATVLREIMVDQSEKPELRAAIAKNVLDMAHRYDAKKG
jgi:hypothetical protein